MGQRLDATFDLLTMTLTPGVSPRHVRELRARGALADAVIHSDELLPGSARHALLSGEARRRAEAELAKAASLGFRVVGLDEPDYPDLLAKTYDPPPVIWVWGTLRAGEGARSVAVVGSRKASVAGIALARGLGRDLARAGITVVSGLARGIDTAAHQGVLDAAGRTIAVLGSGLDCLYPPENARLAARVAEQGALVSEFPFGTEPFPSHFPQRNRVIAGWGRTVVVAEAAERSGALGTARCALDEGRDVMAVPGHPSQETAAGTNALIRDGAVLVRGAADVLAELGLSATVLAPEAPADDDVLVALKRDRPTSLEELQARSGRAVPELLQRLSLLEVGDKVRRLPGPLYVRN
jgi:DNA processing protein